MYSSGSILLVTQNNKRSYKDGFDSSLLSMTQQVKSETRLVR